MLWHTVEHPHDGFWLHPRLFPHPHASIEAPTGEPAPIGTPGQRVHGAALAEECLQRPATVGVPKLDDRIICAAGEHASIGAKARLRMLVACQLGQSRAPLLRSQRSVAPSPL